MEESRKIRVLVTGFGNMGSSHARDCAESENIELVGICDAEAASRDRAKLKHPDVPTFADYDEALERLSPDGVVIATPHFDHPRLTMAAFSRGIHVLVEKPIAVHAKAARQMVAAWDSARAKKPDLVFAAMFQQRTFDHWRKIKAMIDGGELGKLVRATWLITDWFRTQSYYDSGNWRATWRGEGGGVLLNQCPHNLDLYRWFVGLPSRVVGFCGIGKYHDIEVEDEVTAYLEHDNGMVGHFVTSTGESPGTNRLEIVGENGAVVWEREELRFRRNRVSMLKFLAESKEGFAKPEFDEELIPIDPQAKSPHGLVLEDFVAAIRDGHKPLAPAPEGLESVLLGNAILYSSLTKAPIDLPMDEEAYAAKLEELAATSRYKK